MEFDILLYLAQKRGNVVSSEELFEKVWKEKYLENNNTVMVHIRRIREKQYGELDIKLKNEKFIKLKNSIARKSVIKILLYSLGAIILFSVLIDGVYNDELADSLASVNRDIYYWCIANKIILLGITYLVIFAIISFLVIRNTSNKRTREGSKVIK